MCLPFVQSYRMCPICETKISASAFNQHHVAVIVGNLSSLHPYSNRESRWRYQLTCNVKEARAFLNTHNLVWKSSLWLKHYRISTCLHTYIWQTYSLKSPLTIIFSDPIISEWSSSRQDEARHCPSLSQDSQHGQHVSGIYFRGKNAPRIYFLCQKARSRTHVFVKISVYWEHPNDVFCLISFLTFFLKPGRRWLKQRSGHGGRQKARGGCINVLSNISHHYWDLLYLEP